MTEQKMEYFQDFSKEMNYNYEDYNNYQSWSNKGQGEIKISNIDEYNNIISQKFNIGRIQKLNKPFETFVDTNLAWSK
tara:strand:- start:84 stop:317 length:234 start_codon:yes stop_codon:yes gene_type:complete